MKSNILKLILCFIMIIQDFKFLSRILAVCSLTLIVYVFCWVKDHQSTNGFFLLHPFFDIGFSHLRYLLYFKLPNVNDWLYYIACQHITAFTIFVWRCRSFCLRSMWKEICNIFSFNKGLKSKIFKIITKRRNRE